MVTSESAGSKYGGLFEPLPCCLHMAEISGLIAFLIYQHEQGYDLTWIGCRILGTERPLDHGVPHKLTSYKAR